MQFTKYLLWINNPWLRPILQSRAFRFVFRNHAHDQYEILGLHYTSTDNLGVVGKSVENLNDGNSYIKQSAGYYENPSVLKHKL